MLLDKYYVDEIYDAAIVTPDRVDVARAALARHRCGLDRRARREWQRISRRASSASSGRSCSRAGWAPTRGCLTLGVLAVLGAFSIR